MVLWCGRMVVRVVAMVVMVTVMVYGGGNGGDDGCMRFTSSCTEPTWQ